MVLTSILNYKLIRKVRTKYLVRIFFSRKKSYAFFLSEKQYKKLYLVALRVEKLKKPKGEILVVIDDERERFVWCGVDHIEFSDKDWLAKHFNAKVKYNFYLEDTEEVKVHIPEKIKEIPIIEPKESLIR